MASALILPKAARRIALIALTWSFVTGCDDKKPLALVTQPSQTAASADDPLEKTPITPAERDEAMHRIDKAIQAHGGPARLARLQSMTIETKGILQNLPTEQKLALRFPDRLRATFVITSEAGRDRLALALYPKGGWLLRQGLRSDMSDAELADTRSELYVQWLQTLSPLKTEDFRLRPSPEVSVNNRPAIGVLVMRSDQSSVQLLFDKESGLLTRLLVPRWKEAGIYRIREVLFTQHKKIDDITLPSALIDRRDQRTFLEWTRMDYRFGPIDDSVFEKP